MTVTVTAIRSGEGTTSLNFAVKGYKHSIRNADKVTTTLLIGTANFIVKETPEQIEMMIAEAVSPSETYEDVVDDL